MRYFICVLVLFAHAAPALARESDREIRDVPEWTGQMDPVGRTCPYDFERKPNQKDIAICKVAIIGKVTNVAPFTPGLFEEDKDWAYLKQYWSTDKRIYFAATGCDSGDGEMSARAGAEQLAGVHTMRLVKRWDNELRSGKFRPALAFIETERKMACVVNPGANLETAARDADGDEKHEPDDDIPARSGPEPNKLIFKVSSEDAKKVRFAAWTADWAHIWPGSNRSWILSSTPKNIQLTCQPGQKICWGAWREDDETVSWGVGHKKSGCTSCCAACGSGVRVVKLNAGPDRPPPDRLTVKFTVDSPYRVDLSFYGVNTSREWPGGGQTYYTDDSNEKTYDLRCTPQEKICFGAWVDANSNSYWGVGRKNSQSCEGCCTTCGSGTKYWSIRGGQLAPEASNDGGGGGASVLNGLAAGLAVGSAIGRAYGGGGGSMRYTPRPSSSYPSRPPPGQSDISGTR